MATTHASQAGPIDSDFSWLKTHLTYVGELDTRVELSRKVARDILGRIESGRLPYTLGVFGGWGTGKTTFLALVAKELEGEKSCKMVYFNSWKYAGFMEIVPSLIYKIFQYGTDGTRLQRDESASRVLLALGKKYSDQVGSWVETKIGLNPSELFQDVYEVAKRAKEGAAPVSADVIRAYYTQVDKAQDALRAALGSVREGGAPKSAVVVFIDELDRCDPDEAFTVIKQMRVLFGMRDLPIAFVVCANPEPIGLAIKHRYGLESETGDYEARRILEKFVDAYEDLQEETSLRPIVAALWSATAAPWLVRFDEANERPDFYDDVTMNAVAFDTITTAVDCFANLRVLRKSFDYVRENAGELNSEFLWTKWLLEIANQMDPKFRRDLRVLAEPIQNCIKLSYASLRHIEYEPKSSGERRAVVFKTDKGNTLFAILRSFFWEHMMEQVTELQRSRDPQDQGRLRALESLLVDARKMDFVVLLGLLPFSGEREFDAASSARGGQSFAFGAELEELCDQFGYELAR